MLRNITEGISWNKQSRPHPLCTWCLICTCVKGCKKLRTHATIKWLLAFVKTFFCQQARIEQFLTAWKTEFPLLTHSPAESIRCQNCIDARKKNAFTKVCEKYKKDTLAKLALTVDHRAAIHVHVEAKACRQDMQLTLGHCYI